MTAVTVTHITSNVPNQTHTVRGQLISGLGSVVRSKAHQCYVTHTCVPVNADGNEPREI